MNYIIDDDDDDKNDTSNGNPGTADIPALDINPTGTIDTNENDFIFKRFFDIFEDKNFDYDFDYDSRNFNEENDLKTENVMDMKHKNDMAHQCSMFYDICK